MTRYWALINLVKGTKRPLGIGSIIADLQSTNWQIFNQTEINRHMENAHQFQVEGDLIQDNSIFIEIEAIHWQILIHFHH